MSPLVPFRAQIGVWVVCGAAMGWLYARRDDPWFLIGATGCVAAALVTGIAARRLGSVATSPANDESAAREALRRRVCRWSVACALISLASAPLVRLPAESPGFFVPLFFVLAFGHLAIGGVWLAFTLRRRRDPARGPK